MNCSQRRTNEQEQKIHMVKLGIVDARINDVPKPPVGVFLSLWKGLEAVNSFPLILVIPILLDCFLWFGPQFSLSPEFAASQALQFANTVPNLPPDGATQILTLFQQLNLAYSLSFGRLFPPSLLATGFITANPLGTPPTVFLSGIPQVLEASAAFMLLSLPLGSLYWALAGSAVEREARSFRKFFDSWGRVFGLLILASLAIIIGFFFVLLPILFIFFLIAMLAPGVIVGLYCVFFFLFWLAIWILLFVALAPQDAVLFPGKPWRAVLHSVETMRIRSPSAMFPILIFGGLLWLTYNVWSLAPTSNWIGLVGIVGSAYTSSILVAASLEFYRDRRRWVEEGRAYLASKEAAQKTAAPAS